FTNAADKFVGDVNLLGSVMLHELAHNLGGVHEGYPGDAATPRTENCNPNNQGVLNYRYIRNWTLPNGTLTVDLSRGVLNPAGLHDEDEISLQEFFGLGAGTMPYQLSWFAPRDNVADRLGIPHNLLAPAKRHCADGTFPAGNEIPVVRVVGKA